MGLGRDANIGEKKHGKKTRNKENLPKQLNQDKTIWTEKKYLWKNKWLFNIF